MVTPPTTAHATQTLQALYAASRRVAHARTAPQIYRALIESVRDLLGCTVVVVYSAAPQDERATLPLLDIVSAKCLLPRQLHAQPAWVCELQQYRVSEIRLGEKDDPTALMLREALGDTYSQAAAAAVSGEAELHAIVLALWQETGERPDGWQATLSGLAEDAGYGLDKGANLHHQALSDARDAQGLLTAVNAISDLGLLYSSLLDRLLAAILNHILQVMHLGAGAIFLYNEQAEQVQLAMVSCGPAAECTHDPLALWKGSLLSYTLAQAHTTASFGYPSLSLYAQKAAMPEASPLTIALHTRTMDNLVSIPLLATGWLIGVLQVVAAPGERIREGQVAVLRTLAHQAATAIENAQLFAQIRADHERTRAVVDATNDAILMLNEQRQAMLINRRARFFFGLSEVDLLGKSFDQLGHVFAHIFEEGQRFNSWLGTLLGSQHDRTVEEFRIRSPEPRLLQCFSAPVRDVQERYLGRLLVFRDITREREVERMKNDFVSTVSHELRTPLTSIRGALQLVLGKPGSDRAARVFQGQRAHELLNISLANTERLIRLINDILDIAKIEQGRIQLRREALQPQELCQSAATEMLAFANDQGVSIVLQIPPGLPPVLVDRDRAVQILINLLSNAIKFSPNGQQVVLSARHDAEMVCFTVQDYGRGIAPEHQSRLFQKFQQIDSSATREFGGTGLGLAISKALVEEHGGRMWLESALNEGSSFSFTLPLSTSSTSVELLPTQPKVLVAEALPTRRAELCAAFKASGWLVQPVASPSELQRLALNAKAALIVISLPLSSDDADLIRELAALTGAVNTQILLLSNTPLSGQPASVDMLAATTEPALVIERAWQLLAERHPLVLVVDNDPYVRQVLVRLLQHHGLRVAHASDGYAALATIMTQHPALVLLDLKMPGLDGFEVLRRLKANPATTNLPVIILTANELSEPVHRQALELGVRAYLEKPIAYEHLINAITSVLTDWRQP